MLNDLLKKLTSLAGNARVTNKATSNFNKDVSGTNSQIMDGSTKLVEQLTPLSSAYATYDYAKPINTSGNVLGAYTNTGNYYGGTTGATDPNTNNYKADVNAKWAQLNDIYNGLFGDINAKASEQVNQLLPQYDRQEQDLTGQFTKGVGQTQQLYAGRGIADSSYLGDALGQQSDLYSRSLEDLSNDKQNNLSKIGTWAMTQKSALDASKNQYAEALKNLDQYDSGTLASLASSLGGALGNLQQQRVALQTDPKALAELNKITPIQSMGTTQLAQKLQTLVTSSAPLFAKKQIAQGLINSAQLQDDSAKNYWQNYFQGLLGSGQKVA